MSCGDIVKPTKKEKKQVDKLGLNILERERKYIKLNTYLDFLR